MVAYDENLLEKSRPQWQFGDWESLSRLGRETLQHHPDRAKLALLAATGHLQTDNPIMDGKLPRRAAELVLDWAELHQCELLRDWELCQQHQQPQEIEPLK